MQVVAEPVVEGLDDFVDVVLVPPIELTALVGDGESTANAAIAATAIRHAIEAHKYGRRRHVDERRCGDGVVSDGGNQLVDQPTKTYCAWALTKASPE